MMDRPPSARLPNQSEEATQGLKHGMQPPKDIEPSRRDLLIGAAASAAATATPSVADAQVPAANAQVAVLEAPFMSNVSFTVNGTARTLELDTRTTLLDALREHLHLTGSKKESMRKCGALR